MTQKDLAERLNVSDKSVSRWERDDGAPDLSLIPVIAEIFDVSCDELLCGERKPVGERNADGDTEEISSKGEKQRKYILDKCRTKLYSQSLVLLGLIFMGEILMLLINGTFYRAIFACYVKTIMLVVVFLAQNIISNQAWRAVKGDKSSETGKFRMRVTCVEEVIYGALAFCFSKMLPFFSVRNVNVGLRTNDFDVEGIFCSMLIMLIYIIVIHFKNLRMVKEDKFGLDEKDCATYLRMCNKKRKYAVVISIMVMITLGINYGVTTKYSAEQLAEKIYFNDLESFVDYAEADIPYSYMDEGVVAASTQRTLMSEKLYYDKFGNIVTFEEDRTQTITNEDGTILCQYERNNQQIYSVQNETGEQNGICMSVITYEALWEAKNTETTMGFAFHIIYVLEIFGMIYLYRKKYNKDLIF